MRKKMMMLTLALGLMTAALSVGTSSAATQCEIDCRTAYDACVPICSKIPCLVSCEFNLNRCLANCGSES
ncbi:MAG TPA: hypothetical protein VF173_37895 [Thermoanaerobaculia bacterium]|nr:hypothetical protein [Thermoanaerobaculia bacterium]